MLTQGEIERPEMPKITLYVKDADQGIWDKARSLSGDSLSGFVTTALRRHLHQEERRAAAETAFSNRIQEIELEVWGAVNEHRTYKVRFEGVCLVDHDNERIYETAKGNLVVWRSHPLDGATYEKADSIEDLHRILEERYEDKPEEYEWWIGLLAEASEARGEDFVIEID